MARRIPPLRALRAFEAAARHLSFARAADELHVSPAAISQQIRILEDHLGLALFRRQIVGRGTGVTLTEPAQAALPLLSDAFNRLERAAERLQISREAGPLVVSAPPFFTARWLIPRLGRFEAAHPDIDLRLSASTRLVDFDTEDVDLAIRFGAGRYPGLHANRLKDEAVVPVASPGLAAGLKTPADLLGVTLLHNEGMNWDLTHPDWPAWFDAAGVIPGGALRLRPFEDANLVIQAALSGLGVALAWETLVAEDIAAGRLIALFPSRPLTNSFHVVCPPKHLERPKVAAFCVWLREEAAN